MLGQEPPRLTRIALERPVQFDAITIIEHRAARHNMPPDAGFKRIQPDIRKHFLQTRLLHRVLNRSGLLQGYLHEALLAWQRKYNLDIDCAGHRGALP